MACRQIIKFAKFIPKTEFPIHFIYFQDKYYIGYDVNGNFSNKFLYDMIRFANVKIPFYHILLLM